MSAEEPFRGGIDVCEIVYITSMGPRSDERGNSISCRRALARIIRLQWGRAPMSAEISDVMLLFAPSFRLQWGRAPMSAEMRNLIRN